MKADRLFTMRNTYILIPIIFIISILFYTDLAAHTISHDLEQTYSKAYFQLFFISKLLPFIGLGILAFNTSVKGKVFQIRWPFFITLGLGLIIGCHNHYDFSTSMLNKLGLIFIGGLLMFTKNTINDLSKRGFFIFGISLGYEYGGNFMHTESLMWFYILTLSAGSIIFMVLNNIRIIGNPTLQVPLNIFSLFLILAGIALILLT